MYWGSTPHKLVFIPTTRSAKLLIIFDLKKKKLFYVDELIVYSLNAPIFKQILKVG